MGFFSGKNNVKEISEKSTISMKKNSSSLLGSMPEIPSCDPNDFGSPISQEGPGGREGGSVCIGIK